MYVYVIIFSAIFITSPCLSTKAQDAVKIAPDREIQINRAVRHLTDTPYTLKLQTFVPLLFNAHFCEYRSEISRKYSSAIQETGRDSTYAYFTYFNLRGSKYYKVSLTDLEYIRYGEWNVADIKDSFFRMVVPERNRYREPDVLICPSTPSRDDYTFTYFKEQNALQIRLHWRIYCEIIFKLVNSRHCSTYFFSSNTFAPVE